MEIERKYLVAQLPSNLDSYPHIEIEQAYLCTRPTVRVRRMGDQYILTIKERESLEGGAIHNREEEFRLSAAAFESLRNKCDGGSVCKTRYRIALGTQADGNDRAGQGELVAELDIFHGRHDGLRLVEVEFPCTKAAIDFVAPQWFGQEVSSDPHYSNAYLAGI